MTKEEIGAASLRVRAESEQLRLAKAKMQLEELGFLGEVEVQSYAQFNDWSCFKFIELASPLFPARWAVINEDGDEDIQIYSSLDEIAEEY